MDARSEAAFSPLRDLLRDWKLKARTTATAMGLSSSKEARTLPATHKHQVILPYDGPATRTRLQIRESTSSAESWSEDSDGSEGVSELAAASKSGPATAMRVNNQVPDPQAGAEANMKALQNRVQFFEDLTAKQSKQNIVLETELQKSKDTIKKMSLRAQPPCDECRALSQVEKDLDKAIGTIQELEKSCEKFENKAFKAIKAKVELEDDNAKLDKENERLAHKVGVLTKDYNKLVSVYKQLDEDRRRSAAEVQRLQEAADDHDKTSKSVIKNLQKQVSDQEELLKRAQEDAYHAKSGNDWAIEPDATVNASLSSLERAIKSFCKQYAVKTTEGLSLRETFSIDQVLAAGVIAEPGMQALEDGRMARSAPGMLLTAWLTHKVYQNIIADPWFFVPELERSYFPDDGLLINGGLAKLFGLLNFCYDGENKGIVSVRSETFRLLNPRTENADTDGLKMMRDVVAAAKEETCTRIAMDFMHHAHKLMTGPFDEVMFEQLRGIMKSAAEAALKLFIQPCSISVAGLPNLPTVFDSTSRTMKEHDAHIAELDDDETCLDGKAVLLVTQPLVTAKGSSDGSDASVERIMKKAVVWMGKV